MALPVLLEKTLADIERPRDALITLVSDSAGQTGAPAGSDSWGISQIVDHLLLAEGFTNDLTETFASRTRDAGATGFPPDLEAFDQLPPPIGLEAPEPIRPRRALLDLVGELNSMRGRTRGAFDLLSSFDPRAYSFPHPLFGALNLGQWWVLQGVHYGMHLEQARSLTSQVTRP